MKAYYKDNFTTLYHGSCVDIMPTINGYDTIITDPPYGIGFKYEDSYKDSGGDDYSRLISMLKDKPVALLQYPEEMMRLIVPVLGAPDEVLTWVYPAQYRQTRLWNIYNIDVDFSRYRQPAKQPEDPRVQPMVNSYDWFEMPQVKNVSPEKTEHPCQYPVSIAQRIIKLTNAKIILDPFAGSGTTLRAAKDLQKQSIGIEIEEKYCEIIANRLSQEVLNLE